jgi:hypothetical protein
MKNKQKQIVIAAWATLFLSALPEVVAVCRFRWADPFPLSNRFARLIQHRAMFIPLTQWFLMATLVVGWLIWREFRSQSGRKLPLAAGPPVLISLFVNLFGIHTWYHVSRHHLGPQERVDPTSILKPLEKDPNKHMQAYPEQPPEVPVQVP